MQNLSLKIFEKDKKFKWSKNIIIVVSLTSLALLYWLDNKVLNSTFENILVYSLIALGIFMIYAKISSYFNRENIPGKFNGKLTFSFNSISIKNSEYSLSEITKVHIVACDYTDRLNSLYGFDGHRSNGIDNSIEITLNNLEIIHSNFQLNYENQLWKIENILIHYCKNNKLSYYNLLNILNLTDYNQIQKFKKKHCL